MWQQALEIASRVTHPISAALFVSVVGCLVLVRYRGRKPLVAWLVTAIAVILDLALLGSSTYIKTRGLYHIRVVVLSPDGQPANEAELSSSVGGEIKKANKNWEYDLPPQAKPSSATLSLFASVPNAYLSGHTDLQLGDDFYTTATIHLAPLPSVEIRGVVVDQNGHSISEARISELGYPTIATTDAMGNFSVTSHEAAGQFVQVRAEKGPLSAQVSAIAGKNIQIVLRSVR